MLQRLFRDFDPHHIVHMLPRQNRSNFAFRYGFSTLATIPTAKSGLNGSFPVNPWLYRRSLPLMMSIGLQFFRYIITIQNKAIEHQSQVCIGYAPVLNSEGKKQGAAV
jgi:hypothetical protein